MQIYLNGHIVPEAEALVPVTDRGFLYGDGVFETMRSYGGEVFKARRHMQRLQRSASMVSITPPLDERGVMDAVLKTMAANGLEDATIRVTVSRGSGPRGIDPTLEYKPTIVVMAWPFAPYGPALYEGGVGAIIAQTRRTPPSSLSPLIKSCNYMSNIIAKGEAVRAGAFEALMLNQDGLLAEGTICNLFFLRGKTLMTPSIDCGILDGITREHVISLAGGLGIPVKEGTFTPDDLYAADEVFLTSTSMEVMPVSGVDSATYAVGPVTKSLMAAYSESTP